MTARGKKALRVAGIAAAALAVLFCAASIWGVGQVFDDTFARTDPGADRMQLRYADVADRYDREAVSFPSGENTLRGWLYGAGNPDGLVVFSHGMGGGGESYLPEGLWLADHGYQVLLFDNTGCYESDGRDCRGLSQSLLDLDAALTWVESQARFRDVPLFLWGHSWGGYAAAAIFHFDHDIAASVSVAGFNDPLEMVLDWAGDMMPGALLALERPFIALHERVRFGDTLDLTAADALRKTDTPVLLVHGVADAVVGFDTVSVAAALDGADLPNVRLLRCTDPGQDGHNDLLHSPDALAYRAALSEAYDALEAQWGGQLPEAEQEAFFAQIDRPRASATNEALMAAVDDFYRAAQS